MNIIITGSLGHIGKPLTQTLVQKGHSVTVISSNPEKQKDIESLGATAAIGTIEDVEFLAAIFTGADAAYCMLPPPSFADPHLEVFEYAIKMAHTYKQAIQQAAVKNIIHLSSIGAHTNQHNGLLRFHYEVEQILRQLPADFSIKHMRPVAFHYNLYAFANGIQTQGIITSNYGADDLIPWVSPTDIADVIAEEFETTFEGVTIRYIASEELTCTEAATILGNAIGKPDLQWTIIPTEQLKNNMISFGVQPAMALAFVEMNAAMHSGELFEDYYQNKPIFGKVKLADITTEFATIYNKQN